MSDRNTELILGNWISFEEYKEMYEKLEPIVQQFAERHLHGESVKFYYGFGLVTIEV